MEAEFPLFFFARVRRTRMILIAKQMRLRPEIYIFPSSRNVVISMVMCALE